MVNFAREDLCLHQLFERQVRRSPRAPETYELRDGNAYDDRNMRQALRGSGLRRPQINASLFGNYVRYFVNRGWVQASPGLPREIREGAQHGF